MIGIIFDLSGSLALSGGRMPMLSAF